MKKTICLLLSLVLICLCFAACDKQTVSDVVTDPKNGEVIDTATEYITNGNGYIVQPSNALQQAIPGMTMCYLDYVVEDADYLDHVSVAVTPVIIQKPSQFTEFFESQEGSETVKKGAALYDEMSLTDEGKAIYTDAAFYETWNLIILSVRESNADTTHQIDSVSYNADSCILYVNGTRTVAQGEGNATVHHYVFRVPKNLYNGVSHSFTKIE